MTKILIIDDDIELIEMLADYLQTEGYDTTQAHDGEAGVNKALAEQFDALVLDVMMPKLDGFEVLRTIRNQSRVPVIMLTGVNDPDAVIKAFSLETDDYVRKPFNKRELLLRVHNKLKRTRINN